MVIPPPHFAWFAKLYFAKPCPNHLSQSVDLRKAWHCCCNEKFRRLSLVRKHHSGTKCRGQTKRRSSFVAPPALNTARGANRSRPLAMVGYTQFSSVVGCRYTTSTRPVRGPSGAACDAEGFEASSSRTSQKWHPLPIRLTLGIRVLCEAGFAPPRGFSNHRGPA